MLTAVPDTTPEVAADEAASEPSPWNASFDLTDETHCYGDISDVIAEFEQDIRPLLDLPADLSRYDFYDLRQALNEALSNVQDDLNDAEGDTEAALTTLESHLETAIDTVHEHGSCQCGLDSWQTEEEYVDQMLADNTCSEVAWVIYRFGDDPVAEQLGDLTVSGLWGHLNSRDGWSAVQLNWNPQTRTLEFSFDSYPSSWSGRAVALTPEQAELAKEIVDLDSYVEDSGATVLDTSALAVEVTCLLWGDPDGTSPLSDAHKWDISAAVRAVHAATRDLNPAAQAAVLALAENWTSSLAELVATATTVAAAA